MKSSDVSLNLSKVSIWCNKQTLFFYEEKFKYFASLVNDYEHPSTSQYINHNKSVLPIISCNDNIVPLMTICVEIAF